ncbi:MAG TPA: NAD(P)H-hydrate epimerase, partial [Gammaproteobacteria bacterium]|nr:NAD(P)H-hydrate epimerase [Gammaproteobacteria bacterium]
MSAECTQGAAATRPLPREIYAAADVRRLDEALVAGGIAAGELMARAGAAAWQCAQARWPAARRIAVVCGGGNNGGDGWVIARLALAAGCGVEVHTLVPVGQLRGLPAQMAQAYLAAGGAVAADGDTAGLSQAALIVDALFGIGLDRPPEGAARRLIEAINAAVAPVLAVDVPSGLHADSGTVLGAAVRAEATISFVGLKLGPFTGQGPDFAGTIDF